MTFPDSPSAEFIVGDGTSGVGPCSLGEKLSSLSDELHYPRVAEISFDERICFTQGQWCLCGLQVADPVA